MYRRRRRRRIPGRRRRKWHPALVVAVIVLCQTLTVAAVQGTEAGRELIQSVLSGIGNQTQNSETSGQSPKEEVFLGFPEKITVQAEDSQPAPPGTLKDITSSYPLSQLEKFENLKNLYLFDSDYIVPSPDLFDLDTLMNWDLKADLETQGPQILIFHTHGSEYYADSGAGGVIQVGEYLKEVLESKYGVRVMHDVTLYDEGGLDGAYERMAQGVQPILDANPSIQVTIDLHRDGIGGDGRLVTTLGGQEVAQVMIVNGISSEYSWESDSMEEISYLANPNRTANLAFSFHLKMASDVLYPGLMRNIYLSSYRYSTFMREKAILLEVGAQGNTLEECKAAMDYFAPVLMTVLEGKG